MSDLRQDLIRSEGERAATLFDAIAHGDDEHRAWLKEAIKEARIAELEALLTAKPDPEATRTELPLVNAVRSFESADTEYRRAKNIGEQPRLNRAGTRYYVAKSRVFKALHGLARKQAGGAP